MFTKNAIIASAIVVSTFSISQAFADHTQEMGMGNTMTTEMSMNNEAGHMGMSNSGNTGTPTQDGQYPMMEKMLSNSGVITAIQNAGLTVPTAEEMKNFHTSMDTARKAEQELSDANKEGLETLRKTFRKQERDYLRSVGVAFPAESEIEKYQAIHEAIQSVKPGAAVKNLIKKEIKKEVKKEIKQEVKNQLKKPAVKKTIKKEMNKQMNNSAK